MDSLAILQYWHKPPTPPNPHKTGTDFSEGRGYRVWGLLRSYISKGDLFSVIPFLFCNVGFSDEDCFYHIGN